MVLLQGVNRNMRRANRPGRVFPLDCSTGRGGSAQAGATRMAAAVGASRLMVPPLILIMHC